jgi:REP element-mobilizing transposase RayT
LHLAADLLLRPDMTAPRPVFPGRFLFITRRCTQREFLLRPDAATNNAFTYALAEAAQRHDISIILPQMMSNHHHTAAYDPHGNHVEFRQRFHRNVAASQNALRGRWENLWAAEEPCVVEIVTTEDLLEKLVYIATNPVKDGLVEKVHHWPGPNFVQALLSGKSLKAVRPRHFYRPLGPMPAEVELVLGLPDHIEGKTEFLDELRRRIAEVEAQCAQEREKTGRRVVGRRRILRQSWRDSPGTREPRRNLRPRVAARYPALRVLLLRQNQEWYEDYQRARKLWLAGFHVEFPYGTYWLRRYAGVVVKPPSVTN